MVGLYIAKHLSILNLEINSDSLVAVQLIHHDDSLLYSHLTNDCRLLLNHIPNWTLMQAYRESNKVADRLARAETSIPEQLRLLHIPSEDLGDLLQANMLGTSYSRAVFCEENDVSKTSFGIAGVSHCAPSTCTL